MNFINRIIHKIKSNSFVRTYLLILPPVILLLVFFVLFVNTTNANYKKLMKSSYTSNLVANCRQAEESIRSIINKFQLIDKNSDFMRTLKPDINSFSEEDIYIGTDMLKKIKADNLFVDNIVIVNRTNKIVYGTAGTVSMDKFFSKEYLYNNYSIDFWSYYQSPMVGLRVLSPSYVTTYGYTKSVIPVVINKINDTLINSIIIINIDISKLVENLEQNKLTPNSFFRVINKQTHKSFGSNELHENELSDDFYTKIKNTKNSVSSTTINERKYLAVSFTSYDSIIGYTYAAFVPDEDMNKTIYGTMRIAIYIGVFIIIGALVVISFSVKRIFRPVEDLSAMINSKKTSEQPNDLCNDPIEKLNRLIKIIQTENDKLASDLEFALPLVQERNLITILNKNEHYVEDSSEHFFKDALNNFKHSWFCSVILNLNLTSKFRDKYNVAEYNQIQNGLNAVIKGIFSPHYDTYILPSETADSIYILLNLEDDSKSELIDDDMNKIRDILHEDRDYITMHSSRGGIYQGIKGLKRSHREAFEKNIGKTTFERIRVCLNTMNDTAETKSFELKENDENMLIDYLLTGKTDKSSELINEVISRYLRNKVSSEDLMQLYSRIIEIIFKVMRSKNVKYDTNGKNDTEAIYELVTDSPEKVFETINNMLDTMRDYTKNSDRVDIGSIIAYIQEHFSDEFCNIETVADTYNTSSKYLSKKFKETLNTPFSNYLTKCRIEQAKKLLTGSKMTINEISTKAGYSIQSTFIRAFKKCEGITPSEYRKNSAGW